MIFQENVPLRGLNTFKIGGNGKYFCVVSAIGELKEAVYFAEENELPFFVLGGGSNILFRDDGFDGLIIKMEMLGRDVQDISSTFVRISVGAGENWDKLVNFVVDNNYYGIENLSGIPGTVGGAAVQNIGAYGAEVGDSMIEIEVLDISDMMIKTLSAKECLFSYRNSIFKKQKSKNYIVTKVIFGLKKDGKLNISYKDIKEYFKKRKEGEIILKNLRSAILEIRAKKFPDLDIYGIAGSFFKNPTVSAKVCEELQEKYPELPCYPISGKDFRISLAWVLDHVCGLKGFKKGKVGLYENQPLVLVNFGGASANDVKKFAGEIALAVKEKIGIEIEQEVAYA